MLLHNHHTKSQFLQHHLLQLLCLQACLNISFILLGWYEESFKLTIVTEHALTISPTTFQLTHFLFHYLFYSLPIIVTSYLMISVSWYGCFKTSCRVFRCLLQPFLCDCFSSIYLVLHACLMWWYGFVNFPMKILLLTLLDGPCLNLNWTAEKSTVPLYMLAFRKNNFRQCPSLSSPGIAETGKGST